MLYSVPLKPPVWTAWPFIGGVSNYGGGFQPCQYFKDPFGFMHFRGLMVAPSGSAVDLGILNAFDGPGRTAPKTNQMFCGAGWYTSQPDNLVFRIDFAPNGLVTVRTTSGVPFGGAFLSISGITYDVNS